MKIILIIIIIILIVLVSFHLKFYNKKSTSFDIIQIDDILNNYTSYINENVPILFQNHNINNIKQILSPLTINKKEIKMTLNKWHYHCNDKLFIMCDEDVTINMVMPVQVQNFIIKKNNSIIKELSIKNDNYSYSQLLLKKNMIVSIPRFWIFQILSDKPLNILITNTIFSSLFKTIF